MSKHDLRNYFFVFLLGICLFAQAGYSQIRSGTAFLKMLPGPRQNSMAASMTSAFDDPYALFANPGNTGFQRDWFYSGSYNKWIADVFSASVLVGKKIPMPWSRQTQFTVGLVYYGVPEFDSSDKQAPVASANDILAVLSIGQPLSFLSKNISIGTNIKYFQTKLYTYQTSSLIFDAGVTAKTNNFDLGPLGKGLLSAGVALTQVGPGVTFLQSETPLPQTFRFGGALYVGHHKGIQLQLTGDYSMVQDEKNALSTGAEISFRRWFSINGGYNFNSDLMNKVTFGMTFRMDDLNIGDAGPLPGRNHALQMDFASHDEDDFFSRTYRGSITHYPISPENFRLNDPEIGDTDANSTTRLSWETSQDPDVFDDVRFQVFVDRDSTKLAHILDQYRKDGHNGLAKAVMENPPWKADIVKKPNLNLSELKGGQFYWMVAAFDLDQHYCFGKNDGEKIARFTLPYADVKVKDIEFDYSPLITTDDYHGELIVTMINDGSKPASNFNFVLIDSVGANYKLLKTDKSGKAKRTRQLMYEIIDTLKPGEEKQIKLSWHTSMLGQHHLIALTDTEMDIDEVDRANNRLSKTFSTIPKGNFFTADTNAVEFVSQVSIDMPIITEVCFDKNSSVVKPEYLHKTTFDPPIATIAERLIQNREMSISLRGHADPNSEITSISLANCRAKAVKDSLIGFGVNANQLKTLPGKVLKRRRAPSNSQDAKWLYEERRFVEITANANDQKTLFAPIRHIDKEEVRQAVVFDADLQTALPLTMAVVRTFNSTLRDSVVVGGQTNPNQFTREIAWNPRENLVLFEKWLKNSIDYNLEVVDKEGRIFNTTDQRTSITKTIIHREHRLAFPLKFADTDPVYDFYWSRLFGQMTDLLEDQSKRFSFGGFACAIGSSDINQKLSTRRANRFHNEMIKFVRIKHPEYFDEVKRKLDTAKGFGESKPLIIRHLNGEEVLIGNNEQALGRKLNRRIEIIFSIPINVRHRLN